MLCPKCHNVLSKVTSTGKLRYVCVSCGNEEKASGADSLIYSENSKKIIMPKSGRTIWGFPANKKDRYPGGCPACKTPIIAWEMDDIQKVYGCQCGHSWRQEIAE